MGHANTYASYGRPAAVHLDLDGGPHIYAAHGWPSAAVDDRLFLGGLEAALGFFAATNTRATLFVIADDLRDPSKRSLLAQAVADGHEIASHSLTHRLLTRLSRDEQRREVVESRDRITTALGVPVRGFRAPGFDINRPLLELLDAAGYVYDSSMFPTAHFARRVGVSSPIAAPHHPLRDRPLLELPLPAYRPLPTPFHPSYSLVLGMWYFRLGRKRFERSDLPLVLLFHLTDFAHPLPRNQRPSWRATLYTLSHLGRDRKLARCRGMLDLVRRSYSLLSTEELLRQVQPAAAA
jgi:peptidoglycan/xylan/chitin deacetylase (PgdA/CDA1 family)